MIDIGLNNIVGLVIVLLSYLNIKSCIKDRRDEAGVYSRPLNNVTIFWSVVSMVIGIILIFGLGRLF